MTMVGFQLSGATLNGSALVNVRIEKGELVAEQNGSTLHGGALQYAHLIAQVHNTTTNPVTNATVEYKIDETAKTATLTWEYPNGATPPDSWYTTKWYTPFWGSVDRQPNGNYLVTAGIGAVRVWLWRGEDLVGELCGRLTRNLTPEEWQGCLIDEPYRKICPDLP